MRAAPFFLKEEKGKNKRGRINEERRIAFRSKLDYTNSI